MLHPNGSSGGSSGANNGAIKPSLSRTTSFASASSSAAASLSASSTAGPSTSTLTALRVPRAEQDSLGGWFRHMIDKPKYAVFEAKVVIQELGNVPQLEGKFEAEWKFRGRKPHGKDTVAGVVKKPSLPNMRLTPVTTLQPTPSLTSLRSTETASSVAASSVASSPGIMLTRPSVSVSMSPVPSSQRISTLHAPHKSHTAGGSSLHSEASSSLAGSSAASRSATPGNGHAKKMSDPTPLRQSTGPGGQSVGAGETVIEGDAEYDSPTDMESAPTSPPTPSRNGSNMSPQSSLRSQSSTNSRLRALTIDTQSSANLGGSRAMSRTNSRNAPSSVHSVPLPRSSSGIALATRSGTAPSASTLLEPVPGRDDLPLVRPASFGRTESSLSSDSTQTISPVLVRPPSQLASGSGASGTSIQKRDEGSHSSSHATSRNSQHKPIESHEVASNLRKGTTPARPLRQHTCAWRYTTSHTIRIPTGKAVAASGAATPGRRENAPILGGGPHSDSGYRLTIYEIRSTGSTSAAHPTGMGETPLSVLAGAHTALHHPDRHASDGKHGKDGAKGKEKEKGEKMVYGSVDIDLAPFAGKGRTGRRFLLKGSRTNATVKVEVEMRWVGGESHWAAPPLVEGHHVTGMRDLVGDETPTHHDLTLARNTSNSSSGSSASRPSGPSRTTSSLNLVHNRSDVSLSAVPAPKIDYKSYDHHLKPSDASRSGANGSGEKSAAGKLGATLSSLSRLSSRVSPTPQTPPESPSGLFSPLSPFTPTTPETPRERDGREKELFGTFSRRKTVHHHHSLHFRRHAFHGDLLDGAHHSTGHGGDDEHESRSGHGHGVGGANGHSSRHHHHHHHHRGLTEIQPELIIEAIFNPHPAREEGPMTYVPQSRDGGLGLELEAEDEVLIKVFHPDGVGRYGSTKRARRGGGDAAAGKVDEQHAQSESQGVGRGSIPEESPDRLGGVGEEGGPDGRGDMRQYLGLGNPGAGGGAGANGAKGRMWGRMRARTQSGRREKDKEKDKDKGEASRDRSNTAGGRGSADVPAITVTS